MSIIINTNISSMQGIAALNKNTTAMNKALERLSTGCRINSSKDDAAGCAISTSLTKEVSSLNVAQSNAQMGQSLIDTANGALSNMSNMLHRIRDLAEQSANGAYGDDERKAMQSEVNNLVNELYRTKNSTEFNGKQILGAESTHPITEEEAKAQNYTIVKTAEQLKTALTTDENCKVMLFADINLDDLETVDGSNWTHTTCVNGVFDGNGFTIYNLKINEPGGHGTGLFNYAYNATIKNLSLENVYINAGQYVGAIVGEASDDVTIENCNVSGTIIATASAGGVLGRALSDNVVIKNCSFNGTVTGTRQVGGIVGDFTSDNTIENCIVSADISGSHYVGGIGGRCRSTIKNCSMSGSVIGYMFVGGIAGLGSLDNCTSSADIEATKTVGGLSGSASVGGIVNSKTTGKVSASSDTQVGAICGVVTGTIEGCEYNSAVNEGMKAVGNWADEPTEDQIRDNPDLVIDPFANPDTAFSLQVGIDNEDTSVIDINTGFKMGLFNVNISTEAGARKALAKIDALMTKMTDKQTELGAISSRLDSAMQYQAIQKTAKIATNSLIKDADFAAESSNYIKQQILQQTTSSLLSTANQNPNIALMLLNAHRAA